MDKLFKDFTHDELEEMFYGWDNEGVLYGWLNGEANEIREILETNGYNLDSISVMNEAYETLEDLI